MDTAIHGSRVFDTVEELPPIVTIGAGQPPNAYADALVKRVVFSDAAMAQRWQARVESLRVLPVSQRSRLVSA